MRAALYGVLFSVSNISLLQFMLLSVLLFFSPQVRIKE